VAQKATFSGLFCLSDGFQMPENISPYFSFKETLMLNLTQVVSYFSEHL